MGLLYHHLNESHVRAQMVQAWSEEWGQLEDGYRRGECYGSRLTDSGWEAWVNAMPHALDRYDDNWLVQQMDDRAYWLTYETRRSRRSGRLTVVHFNARDALMQLCLGEFNTAYIRGLARALVSAGETHCQVYRAADALEPRSECSRWEGSVVSLQLVLDGHRARYWPRPGNPRAWSLPTGPNCHHSIRSVLGDIPA